MIESLHRDAWFRVERMPRGDVYRVERSAKPAPDAASIAAVERALANADRHASKLLLDLRAAPHGERGADFSARFARVAVVGPGGFADDDAAMDHLLGLGR